MFRAVAVGLIGILLVSCDADLIEMPESQAKLGSGMLVGSLPDGREVWRYPVRTGGSSRHYVYTIGDDTHVVKR